MQKGVKAMFRNFKVLLIALVVVAIAVSAYAFAAANTVPASSAGAGSNDISGYTITSVAYNLDATDPRLLDSVSFTLSAAAGTVKIKLVNAGSTWYDCDNGGSGNNWTCDTSDFAVSSIDKLDVVATSN